MTGSRQRGYVLLTVVVMLFIVAATAFLVSYDTSFQTSQPTGELEAARADYVAEAALQHALWQNGNNACVGDFTVPATALGPDSYTAAATGGGSTSRVVLPVDQDGWVRGDQASKNHGVDTKLHIRSQGGVIEQALYRFDLSSLAAGTQVNSAVAWFYLRVAQEHPEGPVTVHRVTADWDEPGLTWNSIEFAYDPAALATIPAQAEGGVWIPINLTSQVQAWVNGGPNYGILFTSVAEGIHAQYASREDVANPPRLEVTIGTSAVSPVDIVATGTLAHGVIRTLHRQSVLTYQSPATIVAATGPDVADTYVSSSAKNTNYGDDVTLQVGDAGTEKYALLDFNLGGVPRGARIMSAELSLNLESFSAAPDGAMITAHRMLMPWTESVATYKKSKVDWVWPENHDTTSFTVGTDFAAPSPGWIKLEIGALFSAWSDNAPDFGLALAGSGGVGDAVFTSSDGIDPALHPRLKVTYACNCDSTCLPPQGSGAVVLMVEKVNGMTPHEQQLQRMIESWGYSVTVVGDTSDKNELEVLAEDHDVVFVADTAVVQAQGKVADLAIGVVAVHGDIGNSLGLAATWNASIGSSMYVFDNTHYITQPFLGGDVQIYDANMEGMAKSGASAPDLQMLGAWNGAGGLVALDKGGQTTAGASPGRRVLLPLGRNKITGFDLDFLNQNGRLMVQRSIEWAMGPKLPPTATTVLMVVGDPMLLTEQEIAKSVLLEGWGYKLSLIDDDDSQLEFDAALLESDVVFVSREARENKVRDKLTATSVGIVNEDPDFADEIGFSDDTDDERNETDITIDNSFFITLDLPAGDVTVLAEDRDLFYLKGNIAPGADILATVKGEPALATLEEGAEMADGDGAAGRRVFLPWGEDKMDIALLNADGLSILRRSLDWAGGAVGLEVRTHILSTDSEATLGGLSFTDRDLAEYDTWTDVATLYFEGAPVGLSKEIDALHVLENGILMLSTKGDATLGGIALKDGDLAIYDRLADSAYLVFKGSELFSDPKEKVISVHLLDNGNLILSTDGDATLGGLNFKEEDLVEYNLVTDTATMFFDGSATTLTKEISSVHILDDGNIIMSPKGDTTLGGENIGPGDLVEYNPVTDVARVVFYGGDVFTSGAEKIMSVHYGPGTGTYGCDGTFRDEFNAISFSGSDGTLEWAGDWLEVGESDGPDAGDVAVANDIGNYQLQTQDNDNGGEGVEREVYMAGATNATLTYDYRRDNLGGDDDYTAVEVSANGAAGPWIELARYAGPADDGVYQTANHDISAYASGQTRIRFKTGPDMDRNDVVWFDNVEISCNVN